MLANRLSESWRRTTFSRILDRKEKFDTGLQFFKISGLRVVLLRRGFTIADLKADGKRPECTESLMIDVRCGKL